MPRFIGHDWGLNIAGNSTFRSLLNQTFIPPARIIIYNFILHLKSIHITRKCKSICTWISIDLQQNFCQFLSTLDSLKWKRNNVLYNFTGLLNWMNDNFGRQAQVSKNSGIFGSRTTIIKTQNNTAWCSETIILLKIASCKYAPLWLNAGGEGQNRKTNLFSICCIYYLLVWTCRSILVYPPRLAIYFLYTITGI